MSLRSRIIANSITQTLSEAKGQWLKVDTLVLSVGDKVDTVVNVADELYRQGIIERSVAMVPADRSGRMASFVQNRKYRMV